MLRWVDMPVIGEASNELEPRGLHINSFVHLYASSRRDIASIALRQEISRDDTFDTPNGRYIINVCNFGYLQHRELLVKMPCSPLRSIPKSTRLENSNASTHVNSITTLGILVRAI